MWKRHRGTFRVGGALGADGVVGLRVPGALYNLLCYAGALLKLRGAAPYIGPWPGWPISE